MHALSFLFLCLSCLACFGGADSQQRNSVEIHLLHHANLQGEYDWWITDGKLLATPEWKVDSAEVPVTPAKAWGITKGWFKKTGLPVPQLVRIEIHPVVPANEETRLNEGLRRRFYYVIVCGSTPRAQGRLDSTKVVVLMDGTVLESSAAKTGHP